MAELFARGEKPEYLFWVGCAGAYDDRYKKVTRAFTKILVHLNISPDNADMVKNAIDTNRWKVIVTSDTYTIVEITGDQTQIDFALARLETLDVADITRTGLVALKLDD